MPLVSQGGAWWPSPPQAGNAAKRQLIGSSLTLPPHPGTKSVPHGGCDPLGAPILGQASLWGEETSLPLTWRPVGGDPAAPLSGQSHGVRRLGPVRVCISPEMLNSRESTLPLVERERLWKKEKSFIFYYLSWPFSLHFEQQVLLFSLCPGPCKLYSILTCHFCLALLPVSGRKKDK